MCKEVIDNLTFSEKIEITNTVLNHGKTEFENAFRSMCEINDEITDILHQIELMEEPTESDKLKWFDELRNKKQERRIYKDIVAQMKPIYEYVTDSSNFNFLNKLKIVAGDVRKASEYCKNRTYRIRVREDIDSSVGVKKDNKPTDIKILLDKYRQDYINK